MEEVADLQRWLQGLIQHWVRANEDASAKDDDQDGDWLRAAGSKRDIPKITEEEAAHIVLARAQ